MQINVASVTNNSVAAHRTGECQAIFFLLSLKSFNPGLYMTKSARKSLHIKYELIDIDASIQSHLLAHFGATEVQNCRSSFRIRNSDIN